jgi:type II secretory pathway pseudopilin PulG
MKNKKNRKRSVTLIEIMIVILLIGLIGGALAFNMRGSMDKGKLFKTEQNCARVYDALMMEYAKGEKSLDEIVEDKERILENSPLVKGGKKILKDAWGNDLTIVVSGDELQIFSAKAQEIENAQRTR